MAIICHKSNVCFLSHEKYLNNTFNSVVSLDSDTDRPATCGFCISPAFFQTSYGLREDSLSKRKRKVAKKVPSVMTDEVKGLKERFDRFMEENANETMVSLDCKSDVAKHTEDICYNFSEQVFQGSNDGPCGCILQMGGQEFLLPPFSQYYNQDISDLRKFWDFQVKYDLVILDPPWWNKYIKRLKKRATTKSYKMMSNAELKTIPLSEIITENAIVAVWCTNAESHLRDLRTNIFKAWNLVPITTWNWVKVSKSGAPICEFNAEPTGKQPFEKIVIGVSSSASTELIDQIDKDKIVVSQPAAHHSHKPPLVELFKKLLPKKSKNLELFARNLLPGFTSVGNEVLKFQNAAYFESLT